MKQYLQNILEQSGAMTTQDIITNIVVATLLSIAIYLSYWITHSGTAYSKKFNVSLVTLTILTATVMTVIGNNIALSLGMVGALSIVRFRTAIKDSRDTTYIFWTIIVGICCGVGDYLVAGVGSAVVFVVLLLFGRIRNENRMLLIIKCKKADLLQVEGVVSKFYNNKAVLKVKNTTIESCELIFEMTRRVYSVATKRGADIVNMLYDAGEIEYVNIVSQSDEITG